jgi:energy-coupling factor transporter ATP-binding protein EcfA2
VRPKAARDRADPELFWLIVAVVCALLVGLRRSSPAIRADVAEWWDRWSTVVLVVSVLAASALVAAVVLRARRRYRLRVAESEAEAAERVALRAEPLPRHVDPFLDLPPEGGGPVLRYAVAEGGGIQGWPLDGPDAHLLVTGPPGSGKTNLLQVLAVEATRQGVEVVAADPKRIELIGLRNWPGVSWVATDVDQIGKLITAVHAEMERRFELIEHRAERREPVRPGELRPILVLLDELPVLCGRLDAAWQQHRRDTDPRRHPAIGMVAELATLARPARVHLAVATDRPGDEITGPAMGDHLGHRVALTGPSEPDAMTVSEGRAPGAHRTGHRGRATASSRCGSGEVQCVQAPDLNEWSESAACLRPSHPPRPTLVPMLADFDRSAPD